MNVTAKNRKTTSPKQLPSPDERPDADVVIYDAHCRFCTMGVRRLAWFDWGGRLAFLSLHDPVVQERYSDLTHERLMEEMYVVDQAGNRHAGAAAFRYLTRRLPLLWPIAPLMHLPFCMPIWHWMYKQVARRRYLFGKVQDCDGGTCHLHYD